MIARNLRSGYTTGSCAAAAAKAAVLRLVADLDPRRVTIGTPTGRLLELPVHRRATGFGWAEYVATKDGGDDPDVTHGLLVGARVEWSAQPGVLIKGGSGVGVVTKPGLAVPVGEPAINPVPRSMIQAEVREVLHPGQGVQVTIFVPRGEEIARRTMNGRLGIVGGISILGTTGVVEPMSESAFRRSLAVQVGVAVAEDHRWLVLTAGRMGEKVAIKQLGFPPGAVVLMSNFVGYLLEACVARGVKGVLLLGHHGKLVKVAGGVFNTHSRVADARLEIVAAHAAALGASSDVVQRVLQANTAEAVLPVLREAGLCRVLDRLATVASRRAEEYTQGRLRIGTVFLDLQGTVLAADAGAREIGRELGWVPAERPPAGRVQGQEGVD